MLDWLHLIIEQTMIFIGKVGYFGIFIGMFLESTIFPLPSELIMIPAGFAASKGILNIYLVVLIGVLGNVLGAMVSYFIAFYCGRFVFLKIGKYFFLKPHHLEKIEIFFKKYGNFSVFFARLIPGFRHFISIPAGLAKMNFTKFSLYTFFGSTIWTTILTIFGYFVGKNQDLIEEYLNLSLLIILVLAFIAIVFYKKRYSKPLSE